MIASDKPKFANIMFGLGEYFGKQITQPVIDIYWRVLENYDLRAIDRAVSVILSNPEALPFMPKANEIIAAMPSEAGLQWLSADEAWAHVVSAHDEKNSVVFPSDEAQKAWHQAAQPIFNQRDQSPARMAFRAAYDRLVSQAKAEGRRPSAEPSFGSEPSGRQVAIDDAVRRGWLTIDSPKIPEEFRIAAQPITDTGRLLAGMVTGETAGLPEPKVDVAKRIREMMKAVNAKKSPEEIKAEADALKRADMERRRQEAKEALRGQA